jgi:hypothetical protein
VTTFSRLFTYACTDQTFALWSLQFGEDQSLLMMLVEQAQQSQEASWRVGVVPIATDGNVSKVYTPTSCQCQAITCNNTYTCRRPSHQPHKA